jgi:hypothetical protein
LRSLYVRDNRTNEESLRFDSGNTDFCLPMLVELLIFIVAIYSLRETLKCLYSSDDLVNSLSRTGIFLGGVSVDNLFHYFLNSLNNGILPGRIMVGLLITEIPMLFFNIVQYRIYVLFLIFINIWLFGKCVYQWTGSYKVKWLSMLMVPLLFQIYSNYNHHPILDFYGLMPLVFIALFSSMYFFWKFCVEHKKIWLIISGLFYIWGLASYEVAFVFILIFILLAYFATKNLKKSAKNSLLHIALFLVFVILNLIISPNKSYTGATVSLNLLKVVPTTLNQMSATIPLSNFWVNNFAQYGSLIPKLFSIKNITLSDILTVVLFLISLFLIYKTTENRSKQSIRNMFILLVLGFMMVLLPATLIGLSAKYQNEVTLGVGYIPVYIQYFGLIVLSIAVYILIKESLRKVDTNKIGIRFLNILAVFATIFILLTNQQYARASINTINNRLYNNMLALQYSLQDDILGGIPDNSLIVNTQAVSYQIVSNTSYSSLFFINYSQKPLSNVVYVDDYMENIVRSYKAQGKLSGMVDVPITQPTYIVRTNRDPKEGVIYIGEVKHITINLENASIIRWEINELRIYTMKAVTSKYVSLYENINGMSTEHRYYLLENILYSSGENGRMYKYEFNDSLVDFNSVFLVNDLDKINPEVYSVIQQPVLVDLAKPVIIRNNSNISRMFGSGWSYLEDWGRWSEGTQSTLLMKIGSTPDSELQITFTSIIYAPKEKLSFSIYANDMSIDHFSLPDGMQQFSIVVPRENIKKNNSELRIMFDIENPISPVQVGYSGDPRMIGIGLESFLIETVK